MMREDELKEDIRRGRDYKISTASQLIDYVTDGILQCLELGFRQEASNELRGTSHRRIRFYNDVIRYASGLEVYEDRRTVEKFLDGIGYGRQESTT